jgi:hypothetical protein
MKSAVLLVIAALSVLAAPVGAPAYAAVGAPPMIARHVLKPAAHGPRRALVHMVQRRSTLSVPRTGLVHAQDAGSIKSFYEKQRPTLDPFGSAASHPPEGPR